MTDQRKLRPREAEALCIWDSLSGGAQTYATVADRMGMTHGRAAVYVREALKLSGRADEAPRRANGRTTMPTVQAPTALIEAAMEQTRSAIETQELRVQAAQEAAEGSTPRRGARSRPTP
jgi:hypothetical protein